MKDFEHFLLTRFNTRHKERASADWLRHRIGYFERLCHYSVVRQSTSDFRWLIYFDAERDEWFESEVERLCSDGSFEPIWVDGPLSPETAAAAVEERTESDWVITTRVDNDDAISRDFMESVQAQFHHQSFEFVNFQSGLQTSDSGDVYYRSDPSGPFLSLIERRNDRSLQGVYVGPHDKISDYGSIRGISSHPMWLQMVHDRNLGNALRGIRASPAVLAQHFDVAFAARPVSTVALRSSQALTALRLIVHVLRQPRRLLWVFRVARTRYQGGSRLLRALKLGRRGTSNPSRGAGRR